MWLAYDGAYISSHSLQTAVNVTTPVGSTGEGHLKNYVIGMW